MIKSALTGILTFLIIGKSSGQQIQLLNQNDPIAHAAIRVNTLSNISDTYITDATGLAHINLDPPYIATTSHINYETRVDTIFKHGELQWQMTPKENLLGEVVVTGQFQPQSVKQSVYNVRVLNKNRLEAQAAQSLPEVLATELNFRFRRDNAVGSSTASLQGLSGQNIKVLIDGVPLVGRSGVSNEIDLSQININSIEQVEIVEGPMAVNYGADALAGVINLITKQPDANKWSINLAIQEETAGKEYQLFDEGIHNLSLLASYALNASWSVQSEIRHQKFGGWGGTGRDKLWYPKSQFFQSALLRYSKNNLSIHYRLDYLNETIENQGQPEPVTNQDDPYAFDKNYLTSRWMHQLQADYMLEKGAIHTVASYSDYDRMTHRFKSYLIPGVADVTTSDGQDAITFNTFFFRTTLDDAIQWSLGQTEWHTQIGIDGTFESAHGTTLNDGDKHMNDLGFFASTEIALGSSFKVRPGIRLTHNSTFSTNPSASINLKYDLTAQSQIRLSYGRGFRAPSLRELYHEFVDNNHNILGNSELKPEYSNNLNGDFSHQFKNTKWSFSVKGFYNDINNRITYFTPEGANQATTYTNLLRYKTLGSSGFLNYKKNSLLAKIGFSYIGRYHSFSSDASSFSIPQFLYSPEFIANMQYQLFKTGIKLASFYKFTGASKQYQSVTQTDGSSAPELRQLDGFHFWDVTISKDFFKTLSISLGAKNLMDVTSVNNTSNTSSAHAGNGDGQSSIAYGRSYFLKLNYNFSK
ncbi:outer membrane receptor for ferrienterochelin and colicins [Reichenbachiella faecimaris]|uniref:Outer membrane receptor for ferrienterochelin and colicins n=1 Tax=Reichenbachiella faecimaris TaxID=692418 RepID=A0A1W2GC84_REIFA|nr:TonB-dependent receptor [Reichenbachiella faecimaris]SMD33896.1 outer membrane receptor for ferrienterochelin and colicins [Reichenbachiella faecimaris]